MLQVGLFYGSTTGNTEDVADALMDAFNALVPDAIETSLNIADVEVSALADYDLLILGVSTWDIGEAQYDWQDAIDNMDGIDLSGRKVAIFGLGDQDGYPDSYQDAIGILGKKVRELGAELVGFTSTEGHDFNESQGVEDDKFMGLALDEDNQDDLSEERISAWVKQLQEEFGL